MSSFFLAFKFVISTRPSASASSRISLHHWFLVPNAFVSTLKYLDFAKIRFRGVFAPPLCWSISMRCLRWAGTARGLFVDARLSDTNEVPEPSLCGTTDGIAWVFAVSPKTDTDGERLGCDAWRAVYDSSCWAGRWLLARARGVSAIGALQSMSGRVRPTASNDVPPSRVKRGRTRSFRKSLPSSRTELSLLVITRAEGENTTHCPVARSMTSWNHCAVSALSPADTCRARCLHHDGEVKRWQIMKDARSSMVDGMTVGSWTCGEHGECITMRRCQPTCVAIMTRVARCRCRRMMLDIDCVRRAVSLLIRYLWASSRTTAQIRMIPSEYTRWDVPTSLPFTDCHCMNKPRTMSNKIPAVRPKYERNNEVLTSAWWWCAHRRGRDPWGRRVLAFQHRSTTGYPVLLDEGTRQGDQDEA